MPRKFLNRKFDTHDNESKISAEDEWAHITDVGRNLDIQDAMDVQDRSIFFNDEAEKPKTQWEKTKEATRSAMDKAGNTGQYIKYVNSHLERKNSEINRIKEIKQNFDREVNLLKQSELKNLDIDKIPTHMRSSDGLKQLKKTLEEEKQVTKAYLSKLKNETWKTESSLQQLELELKDIDSHIKQNETKVSEEEARVNIIKSELMSLSQKFDPKEMQSILKVLEESLEKSGEKNAKQIR